MPPLKSDARPRSAPGARVKAESRASGSASALALTRETGADTLKGRKKRSTSNTVAEPARRAETKHAGPATSVLEHPSTRRISTAAQDEVGRQG